MKLFVCIDVLNRDNILFFATFQIIHIVKVLRYGRVNSALYNFDRYSGLIAISARDINPISCAMYPIDFDYFFDTYFRFKLSSIFIIKTTSDRAHFIPLGRSQRWRSALFLHGLSNTTPFAEGFSGVPPYKK